MVKLIQEKVEGYDNFKIRVKELSDLRPTPQVYVLFTGNKNEDGSSWCPDCNEFEALFEKLMPKLESLVPDGSIFLRVFVGSHHEWKSKDPLSPFRTDVALKLTSIPTLMDWSTPSKKLSDNQIQREDNVLMLFED